MVRALKKDREVFFRIAEGRSVIQDKPSAMKPNTHYYRSPNVALPTTLPLILI